MMKYFLIVAIVGGCVMGFLLVKQIRNLGKTPQRSVPEGRSAMPAKAGPVPSAGAPLTTPPIAQPEKNEKKDEPVLLVGVPLKWASAADIASRMSAGGESLGGVEIRSADDGVSVVLVGSDLQKINAIREVVQKMDVESAVILVRAVVVRDDSARGRDIGLFGLLEDISGATAAPVAGTFSELIAGASYDLISGVATFGTSLAARQVLDVLTSQVALNSEYQLLSQPVLSVLSGRSAVFTSGREIPVPTTIRDSTGSQTSVTYKTAEFRLEVIPTLFPDGHVRLQIKQSNSDVLATVVVSGSKVPELSSQTLQSVADLRPDQLLYMGGIELTTKTAERRGVPILRDIPLVGFVTGRDSTADKKSFLSVVLSVAVAKRGDVPELVSKPNVHQKATKNGGTMRKTEVRVLPQEPSSPPSPASGPTPFPTGLTLSPKPPNRAPTRQIPPTRCSGGKTSRR
jgi:type II secretory pathway component GspD/PulD (secretin)